MYKPNPKVLVVSKDENNAHSSKVVRVANARLTLSWEQICLLRSLVPPIQAKLKTALGNAASQKTCEQCGDVIDRQIRAVRFCSPYCAAGHRREMPVQYKRR